jgi:hypothetical protein
MSSPNDLTTLNAVKQRAMLGVQPDGTIVPSADDNEVSAAITGFSNFIRIWSGQGSLNSLVYLNENYDGNGNQRMFLRTYPIFSLNSVSIVNGGALVPIQLSINGTWGVFIDTSKKSIALRGAYGNFTTFPYPIYSPYYGGSTYGPYFPKGIGNINVQYVAGVTPTEVVNEIDTVTAQTITLQNPFYWNSDGGVLYYPNLVALVNVASAPLPGEYAVSNGLYVFNAADNGQNVAVSYYVNEPPPDLEYAVRCIVAINYKRKGWQDQSSRTVGAAQTTSTTRYQNWEWPPEYQAVLENYQRKAAIVG